MSKEPDKTLDEAVAILAGNPELPYVILSPTDAAAVEEGTLPVQSASRVEVRRGGRTIIVDVDRVSPASVGAGKFIPVDGK